jgi:divalent metal cation (Fe/Co/Zn/Cd) transporter
MSEHQMKPIWYFVGLILLIMGGLILLSGIYHLISPPEAKTVLADLHPDIWWGALMIIFGGTLYLKTRRASA